MQCSGLHILHLYIEKKKTLETCNHRSLVKISDRLGNREFYK